MSVKSETPIQQRMHDYIEARGGYMPKKNHGNMITKKGLQDLPFTYKGFSCFFEVKTPETTTDVSRHQGIHCRLARKAKGLTAVVWNLQQVQIILDALDLCDQRGFSPKEMINYMTFFFEQRGLDDGTKY
jgi:hypothetical protein